MDLGWGMMESKIEKEQTSLCMETANLQNNRQEGKWLSEAGK